MTTVDIITALAGALALYLAQRFGGAPVTPQPSPRPSGPSPDPELVSAYQHLLKAKSGGIVLDDLDREVIRSIKPLIDDLSK
jgi:hypothetical protein